MKTTLTSLFVLFCFYANSQEIATKTKTYYWGTPEHNFHQQLTNDGKQLLNLIFEMVPFDSVECVKLKSEDIVEFTSRKYLSEHKYEYITVYKQNDVILTRCYSNNISGIISEKKKVLLRYSKNNNNEMDMITLHVIY